MINRDIHVVFGECARNVFIHSKKFNLDSIQLICLEDCLNLDPICDLNDVEEIEKRKNWLSKIFEDSMFTNENTALAFIKRDIEKLKTLIDNYKFSVVDFR